MNGLWWSLGMMLFLVVNTHAAFGCIRVLTQEQRDAIERRLRCRRRKRPHGEHDLMTTRRCTVVFARSSLLSSRAKRQRLERELTLNTRLRRETLVCPWPLHVSFLSFNTAPLVHPWLTHPLVIATGTKFRESIQNALQEVLVSCLSFVFCAIAVLLLRKYSTLVVGVSVDLGAFSLEV